MPEKQFRIFIATKESTDEDNTAIAAISTDAIDRDKEVMLPKGVDFENFNKNPVVLWAHDYSGTPVGKAQWVKQGRKYIKAKWEWAETEKAKEIKQLWDGGFLNAISVGFIISKSHEPTPDEIKKNPDWAEVSSVIDEWELLEFSIVPVPANPEALAGIKELGISDATIKELGVKSEEEATVIYAEKNTGDTNNEDVEIVVKDETKEKPIIVVPHKIVVVPVRIKVKPVYNLNVVVDEEIKKVKGIMYI